MNYLNAICIEGDIISLNKSENELEIAFICKEKNGNQYFYTKLYGELADFWGKRLNKDNFIRIVGRLKEVNSRVFIKCEHLEVKGIYN